MHTHLGGSGNHGTSRLVLADGEVVCSDAVIVRHLTYGISQIRDRKFALCLVDVGCNFVAEARHIHIRLRLVLYIKCIGPVFVRVVAGGVPIFIYNLAIASEGRGLQLTALGRAGELTAAGVLRSCRREDDIRRCGVGNALYGCLTVVREGPCARVDRDHASIGGLAALRIHAGVGHLEGVLALAVEGGRIHRQAAGVAGCVVGMGMGGHRGFGTGSVVLAGPHGRVVGETVLKGGIDVERCVVAALGQCIGHGHGDAGVHGGGHRDFHAGGIAHADTVLGGHHVGDGGGAGACAVEHAVDRALVCHGIEARARDAGRHVCGGWP